jgi:lipid A ethanolaminephosphotransferase
MARNKQTPQSRLILFVSLFFVLFYNYTFFKNTMVIYPAIVENIGFLFSLAVILFATTSLVLTIFSSRWTTKPLIIILLIISSQTAYFMNTYNVVIDDAMIQNTFQTDMQETMDLFSLEQLSYLIVLGIIPSYIVYTLPLDYSRGPKREFMSRIKQIGILSLIIFMTLFIFSKNYASFFREHKPLRYSVNPTFWIYSLGNYVGKTFSSADKAVKPLGLDAKVNRKGSNKPKLVFMVVGEAVRADHFSYNGYNRETTPLLKQEEMVNLPNLSSCATSTAVSVPCMFSKYTRDSYSFKKGIQNENVLDVLNHTGEISILWLENNSDSKGVAVRVPSKWYKNTFYNTKCYEGECRDEGMLVGLDQYIQEQQGKDILIVLHQMGNHGPAYYKRYPKAYEKYTPVCRTNQLEACTQKEIANAYDNALLFTDAFLSQAIQILKDHSETHQSAMIYMSDHGESLGENGLYLHGMPYFMAPDAQKHVAGLMWFDASFRKDLKIDKLNTDAPYSHDNLFHTLLGLFEVETSVYNREMDILTQTID